MGQNIYIVTFWSFLENKAQMLEKQTSSKSGESLGMNGQSWGVSLSLHHNIRQ